MVSLFWSPHQRVTYSNGWDVHNSPLVAESLQQLPSISYRLLPPCSGLGSWEDWWFSREHPHPNRLESESRAQLYLLPGRIPKLHGPFLPKPWPMFGYRLLTQHCKGEDIHEWSAESSTFETPSIRFQPLLHFADLTFRKAWPWSHSCWQPLRQSPSLLPLTTIEDLM